MNTAVSRETPPPPDEAAAFFGARLDLAQQFADLLAADGVTRGLIGPREVPRLWDRHLVNCGLLTQAIGRDESICDVGSGAGLPGVVLAILRPELSVTLVEPLLRRVTFLEEVIEKLELSRVTVVRGRAEDQPVGEFDVVCARAVAPMEKLARWCLPLCRPGGRLLAMKGASAVDELAGATAALGAWGAREWTVREFSHGGASILVIEVVAGETESRFERESGATAARSSGGAKRRRRGGRSR
jgi:16S rRNA (guanine527-N7)-methyltransferase